MPTTSRQIIAGDLVRLPDDGSRHELVAGELRTMAPSGSEHGALVMNLSTTLDVHARAHRLGRAFAAETGFALATDPDIVRAADPLDGLDDAGP